MTIDDLRPDDRSVYFIQGETGGPIKIGVTQDVTARYASLQSGCPVPLHLLATVPGAGKATEGRLHEQFAGARLHGEWFEPVASLLELIASLQAEARSRGDAPLPRNSVLDRPVRSSSDRPPITPLDPDSDRGRATAQRLTEVFAEVSARIEARQVEAGVARQPERKADAA